MIVAIIVAIIGVIGTSVGATFAFMQFMIKRKDEKEDNSVQKQINEAVEQAKKEMQEKLDKVSKARSEEGAERFRKHASSIEEINKQIQENSEQIGELTVISKNVLSSMDSLNRVVRASAESQKNSNYDRILFVANKVLKNQTITITEKTNLNQLYESWVALHGVGEPLDPKIKMMYEECMKLVPTPDEQ